MDDDEGSELGSTWTLTVTDLTADGVTGTLDGWSMTSEQEASNADVAEPVRVFSRDPAYPKTFEERGTGTFCSEDSAK